MILKKLADKHSTWLEITMTFGLDRMTAEDLVQDMYIKIHGWMSRNGKKAEDIIYDKDEINYYFVFRTLRTLFLDRCRKSKRVILKQSEDVLEPDYIFHLIDGETAEKRLKIALNGMHWYDKKVFELVYRQQWSILKLSQMTGISYHSLYRTVNKIKKIVKKEIWD